MGPTWEILDFVGSSGVIEAHTWAPLSPKLKGKDIPSQTKTNAKFGTIFSFHNFYSTKNQIIKKYQSLLFILSIFNCQIIQKKKN